MRSAHFPELSRDLFRAVSRRTDSEEISESRSLPKPSSPGGFCSSPFGRMIFVQYPTSCAIRT